MMLVMQDRERHMKNLAIHPRRKMIFIATNLKKLFRIQTFMLADITRNLSHTGFLFFLF